jgi:hypothetical protein
VVGNKKLICKATARNMYNIKYNLMENILVIITILIIIIAGNNNKGSSNAGLRIFFTLTEP